MQSYRCGYGAKARLETGGMEMREVWRKRERDGVRKVFLIRLLAVNLKKSQRNYRNVHCVL